MGIKALSALLIFGAVLGCVPTMVYADQTELFPDIPKSADYRDAVVELAVMGIIAGDENGNFNPESTITRGEAATIICRMLGVEDETKAIKTCAFTDTQNHWSVGYVAKAAELGVINGYNSTTFGPDDPVTYEQMVKMLVCAYGYGDIATEFGGWPEGYWLVASDLSFFRGISCEHSDDALRKNVVIMIDNFRKLGGYND